MDSIITHIMAAPHCKSTPTPASQWRNALVKRNHPSTAPHQCTFFQSQQSGWGGPARPPPSSRGCLLPLLTAPPRPPRALHIIAGSGDRPSHQARLPPSPPPSRWARLGAELSRVQIGKVPVPHQSRPGPPLCAASEGNDSMCSVAGESGKHISAQGTQYISITPSGARRRGNPTAPNAHLGVHRFSLITISSMPCVTAMRKPPALKDQALSRQGNSTLPRRRHQYPAL